MPSEHLRHSMLKAKNHRGIGLRSAGEEGAALPSIVLISSSLLLCTLIGLELASDALDPPLTFSLASGTSSLPAASGCTSECSCQGAEDDG